MTEEERWKALNQLDDELLKGGVFLSESCVFLVREADTTFARGAHLASILTAMAAAETYLKSMEPGSGKKRLIELIEDSGLESDVIDDLHELRKYRNKWAHVGDPWDDEHLLQNPVGCEVEIERMALLAATTLRRVLYSEQCV